jgi:hypothetical protein
MEAAHLVHQELPTGNHMRLDPGADQMESEVAEKLTCRRMVGKEESIQKR